jgi:aspartate kinase
MKEADMKNLSVQKFGGSSLESVEDVITVAEKIARKRQTGEALIIVVSALKDETNRLLSLCRTIHDGPSRESDLVAATGEQVTVGLMSLALKQRGIAARPFLAHQVRIKTDNRFGDARVIKVETIALHESLGRGEIPIVAGFQGMENEGAITTLGRGGSDTTAVALAAAMGAPRCELFKDVDGIYSTDPSALPSAKRLTRLSYSQMLELSHLGAKVLHPRSVELAQRHGVALHVRGSFTENDGTHIENDDDDRLSIALTSQTHFESGDPREPRERVSVVTNRFLSQAHIEARMRDLLHFGRIPVYQTFHTNLSSTCVVPLPARQEALRILHDGIELSSGRHSFTLEGY